MANKPSWQSQQFIEHDSDPLAGFANIMDVMLVFALGLLIVIIDQSPPLREHFKLDKPKELPRSGVDTEVAHGRR